MPARAVTPDEPGLTPGAPNIVLILVDDGRLDDLTATPSIKARIGEQGAMVTRFYSSFPLCCPARATLLTGQYPHNHGVVSNYAPTGGFAEFDDSSTLATWLSPTYRTGLVGKYLNEYKAPYSPPGWDEWLVPQGMYNYTGTKWWLNRGVGGAWSTWPGYQTDTIGTLASDFIRRNAPSQEPFFLHTSIVGPHAGVPADADDPKGIPTPYVKPQYRNAESGARLSDPAFNEADVSDKPLKPAPLTAAEIAGLNEANAQRREALRSAEDAVDTMLDALEATGEADNTYVMFMSDNGYILGEHRLRGGKLAPYEVSNHVPFMVKGPGITAGTVINDVTAQVDYAPTVMSMAGLPTPESVDGVNLLPQLTAGTAAPMNRQGILLEATNVSAGTDPLPWLYKGVVSDGFKYIERTTGKKELYDLAADPSELVNVANKVDYATTQARLAELLATYRDCSGDECR